MANDYYKKLYEQAKSLNKTSTSSDKVGSLQNKIDNLTTRLNAGGVDVASETDSRNFLEKALNLTPDQNVFFDIFELVNRPQQAIFGAIDAMQNDESVLEAAKEGISGNKDTSFKKILTNTGSDMFKDTEGKLDLVDVAGFAGDVLLDPADLALIPVTGGANVAAGAVADAGKTTKQLKSATDLLFEGGSKAIKGTAKLTDKAIEGGLKAVDASKGITYATPAAKSAANLGKEVAEGVSKRAIGTFETYKDMKDTVNRAFNYVGAIPKSVSSSIRKNNANFTRASAELSPIMTRLDNGINEYATGAAKALGDDSADAVTKIAKKTDADLMNLKEFQNYNRETTMAGVLEQAKNGKLTVKAAGDEIIEKLKSIGDDVTNADKYLKLTVDTTEDGFVKLSDDWKYIIDPAESNIKNITKQFGDNVAKDIKSLTLDSKKLSETVTTGANYTAKDLEEFGVLMEKYATDPAFAKLYDDADIIFNEANGVLNKYFGTALPEVDNAGYVRHAFDKEQFDNYQNLGFVSDYGNSAFKGSTKVLDDRLYNMSAREANNMFKDVVTKNMDTLTDAQKKGAEKILFGDGIFKEGMTASFDNYLNNIPKLAAESKLIDDVLVKSTFGDFEKLSGVEDSLKKAIKEGDADSIAKLTAERTELLNDSGMKILTNADSEVPRGFKQLNSDEAKSLTRKMKKISSELGITEMDEVAKVLSSFDEKLAINSDILRLVDITADSKQAKGFTRLYDKYLGFFKRSKVLSPTFQMNNFVGNTSNMYLSGISPTRQAQLFPEAKKVMDNGQDLIFKRAKGVQLTPDEEEILKIWDGFLDAGFGDVRSLTSLNMNDMPESLQKYFTGEKKFENVKDYLVDGLPYLNNKMNNYMDTTSRLVTYMEGISNPQYLQKLGVDSAGDAVRKVLFDPTELTGFEQETMKRIMPFYTFTKKNLAFQMDNLSKNGTKYNRLLKARDGLLDAATGGEEENVPDWLKNNMYIPIPSLGENGEYKIIRSTIPFGNLIESVTDPVSSAVNLTSPLLKMPFEIATNTSSFSGLPIQNFEGEKSTNIPLLTKQQEYLLSNFTGLDVPLKNISRLGEGLGSGIGDSLANDGNLISGIGQGLGQGALNMTTMDRTLESDKLSKMYDQLEELETLMKQYEQQGYEFSTISELEKANPSTVTDNIMATINKLNGIKENPYIK